MNRIKNKNDGGINLKIKTDYYGEIEYQENEIIRFEEGLYGFENMKNFIVVTSPEPGLPFFFFQSIDDGDLMFIITDPFLFVENYDFVLSQTVIDQLKIESIEDIKVYNLVVVHDNVEDTTINLKSPLIINLKNQTGRQSILNEDYEYRRKLFVKGIHS
jgi:flagellar assembly factor FliW